MRVVDRGSLERDEMEEKMFIRGKGAAEMRGRTEMNESARACVGIVAEQQCRASISERPGSRKMHPKREKKLMDIM
jgi:hypothetical protein